MVVVVGVVVVVDVVVLVDVGRILLFLPGGGKDLKIARGGHYRRRFRRSRRCSGAAGGRRLGLDHPHVGRREDHPQKDPSQCCGEEEDPSTRMIEPHDG